MRKKLIAGNWKMNKTASEAKELIGLLKEKADTTDVDVVFCVPFTNIETAVGMLNGTNIAVGAQNMHFEDKGAYTGEISADMLVEAGVKYVVLGHSERRAYFAETDETVNKKVIKAIEKNLFPIVCVGESLQEREEGVAVELVRMQVKKAFKNVSKEDAKKVVTAYEPIWAIGTGKTATTEQAEEICAEIRKVLCEIYDKETADTMRILYGGSVNSKNAAELFATEDIDGGLVGGASLKEDFLGIVNYK